MVDTAAHHVSLHGTVTMVTTVLQERILMVLYRDVTTSYKSKIKCRRTS